SPGGQNVLIQQIIDEFGSRFAPGGSVVYVGDTDEKFAHFDGDVFDELGVDIDPHGQMPDVIIYDRKRNGLFLIEAVTSHGPVNAKRKGELHRIFGSAKAGLVYV